MQTEMHIAEQLVLEPSPSEEIATENLKVCKSLGNGQILAERIQAGGKILSSEIHKPTFGVTVLQNLGVIE
jgi:hypothetical protein